MVPIARRRESEQRLQQPVDRGRGEEVAPAHDVGHALQRVVDDHRQMVARRQVAAAQDDVAPDRRLRRALARDSALANSVQKRRRRRGVERAAHVEAQGRLLAAREASARFILGKRAAGPAVERRAVRVAPAVRGALDLGAAAKAGVDEACVSRRASADA